MSSAILSADDLNDFISPGVACIKPVETLPKQEDSNPYEVTTEDKVQPQNSAPASISLTDCLACSGCVTSAEAVLVSLQSHTEVLNTLDSYTSLDLRTVNGFQNSSSDPNAKLFVASVSPQVRASIAATFGICERRAGHLIEQFLSGSHGLRLGGRHNSSFQYVVDTNQMREACLVLGADEVANAIANKAKSRPVITSACPGWICYAEKTHPHILPHLSALKSPQALTGTLLKSVLSKKLGLHPSQIWHLAIMPCFDKKLEASREELTDRWWAPDQSEINEPVRDVDCVITSRELFSLADARDIQLSQLPQEPIPYSERMRFPDEAISKFLIPDSRSRLAQQRDAGTSGGYLYHVMKTQQAMYPGSHITITRGRNADVLEYSLLSSSGEQIIKCARYYGFRNIQNLVRKLKPAKQSKLPGSARRAATASGTSGNEYTYVEVMACPGGCTNGGGQTKVEDVATIRSQTKGEIIEDTKSVQSQREWLNRVDEAYYSADSEDEDSQVSSDNDTIMTDTGSATDDKDFINGIAVRDIHNILHHWAQLVEVPLEKLAYTTFRKVESDVGKKKNLGDTERIAAIAGMSGGGW